MRIAIINYGAGNLHSTRKAFERIAPGQVLVTSDATTLTSASHIVLPGVGAFGDCMKGLSSLPGMRNVLETSVLKNGTPFLGICVGMQLLAEKGFEHGEHQGLGWLKGNVRAITAPNLKIPHMGWNELNLTTPHTLLDGIAKGDHAYFVHSYHFECEEKENILATTDYGQLITAIVAKDNIFGMQFHPEKSQETGLRLIENFVRSSWR